MSLDWKEIAAIIAAATAIGGLLVAYIKFRLSGDFAKASDVTALGGDVTTLSTKITALEQRIDRMPSHEDMRGLGARIGEVERGVAVVHTKVDGVADLLRRVERQTDLLVQHQINEDGKS